MIYEDTADYWFQKGVHYFEYGYYDEAIECCNKADARTAGVDKGNLKLAVSMAV
jgi:tetratricopeptide (TPR) repeat protein